MSEQFESMMEGLNELLEYTKGVTTKCRVRVVEISDLKIKPLTQETARLKLVPQEKV